MADTEPGPGSFAALCGALLRGHEPPPVQAVARLSWYRWVVVGTVCVGSIMSQLDASLTQVLLPRLERDFHAPLSTVSWVAVAYILTLAAFTPIFGRLADMFGRKLLYTAAFLLFVIGSGLCGFAPDLPTLIGFRVVQGVGAALLTANSVAIIVLAAGPEHRGRALGLQSAAQAIGLGVGPAVGGLVLDTLGWHWAFWINVPIGLLGLLLGWFVLPQTRHLQGGGSFDWHGAFLIAPALTAVVAILNEGHTWGVTSPAFISCVVAAVVLLALFVRAEGRAVTPLIDFALLRQPAFLIGNLANFLSYASLFGVFFLIPFVLVRVYQDSELLAGLRLSIVPVMLGLLAPVGGVLYDRFGARLVTTSGMVVCVSGLAVLYVFADGRPESMPLVMLALAVFGIGQGLFISPNSSAIMATAPEELTGEAGSLLNVMRYLGMSTGIASASTVLALSIAATPGSHGITVEASGATLVFASRAVILMLGVLAVLAGALSLLRTVPRKAREEPTIEA